jgi:glycerate 2-kinase
MYVKNRAELLSHGNRELRAAALDIVEHALAQVAPYKATRNLVRLEGDTLTVGHLSYNLSTRGDIYVLGAGKASLPIAQALEDVLGDRIKDSLVIVKEGQESKTRLVKLREASHPFPDERSYEAAREMMELATKAREGDIVLCAFTGGSSALACYPVTGVSLQEKRKVHQLLLECGATIREINAVRKHLSQLKGGRLALAIFPAEIVNLTVSDVTGDPWDYITCPTVPDTSTFSDASRVLDRYNLWERFPASAAKHLRDAFPAHESPRAFGTHPIHTFLLLKSGAICDAAAEKARELGFLPHVLTTEMEGDSALEGLAFGVRLAAYNGRSPVAFIAGGETTVTLDDLGGEGGPNQEFSLSASRALSSDNQVVLSLDTDGTDGPTPLAGAVTDFSTTKRAHELGIDIDIALRKHDVSPTLKRLCDAIVTGHTGTNVNDLKLGLYAETSVRRQSTQEA